MKGWKDERMQVCIHLLAGILGTHPSGPSSSSTIQLLLPSALPPQTRNDHCSRITEGPRAADAERGQPPHSRKGRMGSWGLWRVAKSSANPSREPVWGYAAFFSGVKAHVPLLSVVHQNGWFDSCASCASRSLHWEIRWCQRKKVTSHLRALPQRTHQDDSNEILSQNGIERVRGRLKTFGRVGGPGLMRSSFTRFAGGLLIAEGRQVTTWRHR